MDLNRTKVLHTEEYKHQRWIREATEKRGQSSLTPGATSWVLLQVSWIRVIVQHQAQLTCQIWRVGHVLTTSAGENKSHAKRTDTCADGSGQCWVVNKRSYDWQLCGEKRPADVKGQRSDRADWLETSVSQHQLKQLGKVNHLQPWSHWWSEPAAAAAGGNSVFLRRTSFFFPDSQRPAEHETQHVHMGNRTPHPPPLGSAACGDRSAAAAAFGPSARSAHVEDYVRLNHINNKSPLYLVCGDYFGRQWQQQR